jgi:tetratricopeptide (TPR) repeat protein
MRPLSIAFVPPLLWSCLAFAQVPTGVADCDKLAASPYDSNRPSGVAGVLPEKIDSTNAIPACEAALKAAPNDPRIMFQLGRSYGAADYYKEAFQQYTAAYARGYLIAGVNLGSLYENGRGIAKDEGEALRLFRQVADQGNFIAQYNLGNFYENGRGGLTKGDVEALRLCPSSNALRQFTALLSGSSSSPIGLG